MSNNAPDYKDDLAFQPVMTWDELVEWVKNSNLVLKCNITMESKDYLMKIFNPKKQALIYCGS